VTYVYSTRGAGLGGNDEMFEFWAAGRQTADAQKLAADPTWESSTDDLIGRAASKVSTDKNSQKYKTAVAAGNLARDQLTKYLDILAQTKTGKTIRAMGGTAMSVAEFVEKAKDGTYQCTPSGVVDATAGAMRILGGVFDTIRQAGVNSKTLDEVTGWIAVGATCTAGAVGGPPGWIACGLSVLGKVLTILLGDKGSTVYDWKSPRSVFQLGDAGQGAMISNDVVQLARVLRWYYTTNYDDMYQRLGNGGIEEFQVYVVSSGRYPQKPRMGTDGAIASNSPVPAHTMRSLLQMLSFGYTAEGARDNVRNCLALLAGYRSGKEPPGRGLYARYEADQEINATTIANGAFFGRCAVATYGHALVDGRVNTGGDLDLSGYHSAKGIVAANQQVAAVQLPALDFTPFIVVDELINFFGAISYVEQRLGRNPALVYRFGEWSPVRHLTVCMDDRQGGDNDGPPACARLDEAAKCWTNLRRAPTDDLDSSCPNVAAAVGWLNEYALREFGAVRLLAAFSQMHMGRNWQTVPGSMDPLAEVDVVGDPTVIAPVDPRQIIPEGSFIPVAGAGRTQQTRYLVRAEDRDSELVELRNGFDGGANGANRGWVYPAVVEVQRAGREVLFVCVPAGPVTDQRSGRQDFSYSWAMPSRLGNNIIQHNLVVESVINDVIRGALPRLAEAAMRMQTTAVSYGYARQEAGASTGKLATTIQKLAAAQALPGQINWKPLIAPQPSAGGGGGLLFVGAAALALLLMNK
jgi:hypothetical protein